MKVATGIYKTAYRYDVRACAQGVTRFASFPLDTKLAAMKHWQEDQRAALRRTKPTLAKGTLAADIVTYLARPEVKAMASRHQREVMLKFWGDRLGHKRRHNITPADIKDGLDAIAHLAPATRNKFRMVLLSLWTALDGPSAGPRGLARPGAQRPLTHSFKPCTAPGARKHHHEHPCSHRPRLCGPAARRRVRQARAHHRLRHRPAQGRRLQERRPSTPSTPATPPCWPRPT